MSILDKLNIEQKKAAETLEGPLLILAGAGSGKTRTITYRIAYMIEEVGISPYKILAMTFTNKAAKEMRERVESLIGDEGKKTMISTFHSFGVRLLRIYGDKLGYNSNFTIYDGDDQKKVIKTILKELVVTDKGLTEAMIASRISKLKEDGITPGEYEIKNKFDNNFKIVSEVYKRYNVALKNNNGMDFSDILVNTLELLNKQEILEKLQDKFQYIMVDEYQDTNNIQYQIINKLAAKYKNLCVVGDENQSIYGFRGANIKNILDFEKDYPNAKIIKLEENYRSTACILDAANAVIKNNASSRDKKLWTQKCKGDLINLKNCQDGRDEVNFVLEEIIKEKKAGRSYKDFTILYRTNAQSRLFEEGLLKFNIPYKIFGGMQFYQRAEIKDILAYLSVINNYLDNVNLTRIINVPKRKIGDKTLEKILNYSKEKGISLYEALGELENIGLTPSVKIALGEFYTLMEELREISLEGSVSELFDKLISGVGYFSYLRNLYGLEGDSRIENVEELKNSIVELEKMVEYLSLREYLENVSLVSATDELDGERDYVKLMTIHNSKGLEFPVVFLVGTEDEIFPGTTKVMLNREELEEERRLCYVAITRAEEKLYISYANSRYLYGDMSYRTKSRFIEEIPMELLNEERKKIVEKQSPVKGFKNFIKIDKIQELNLPYKIGEKIIHKKFGLGKIVGINEKKIEIQFVDGKREIALALADKFITKDI
ncbi:DNA helicase-2 / ATP-dependent DNA helicase PcrA [Cetobacterium ceti]|uniref:DNA 3'-5' helicase n=1 Tax=Cetobacterium ceti TaxID=180163 RepID=A0A1T4JVI2_9FUSO|nr:UvrD-helicase domain-containing protein [Cetobacterium ceti]SJZ34144.1 DNA helicase-2 / ATP-dependent DNA helicase PcrA [Cetobacterium ceti]